MLLCTHIIVWAPYTLTHTLRHAHTYRNSKISCVFRRIFSSPDLTSCVGQLVPVQRTLNDSVAKTSFRVIHDRVARYKNSSEFVGMGWRKVDERKESTINADYAHKNSSRRQLNSFMANQEASCQRHHSRVTSNRSYSHRAVFSRVGQRMNSTNSTNASHTDVFTCGVSHGWRETIICVEDQMSEQ